MLDLFGLVATIYPSCDETMNRPPVTIIYIAGIGHSGSTLLDVLLGSHPDICGVGEIGRLFLPRPAAPRFPTENH